MDAAREWEQRMTGKEYEGTFWDGGNVQTLKGAWVAQAHAFVERHTMVHTLKICACHYRQIL